MPTLTLAPAAAPTVLLLTTAAPGATYPSSSLYPSASLFPGGGSDLTLSPAVPVVLT